MSKVKESSKAPKNGGWGILTTNDKEPKLITNFRVEVVSVIDIIRIPEATATTYVKLKIHFEDGHGEEFTEPLSELEKIKWGDKDMWCWICPDIAPSRAERYITNYVRERLPYADTEKGYHLTRVGIHEVEGEFVFCTGAEVLRPPHTPDDGSERPIIKPEPMSHTLDFDPNLTEEETVAEMFELISLFCDLGRILLAYNLVYFMRELYEYAWTAPRFCLNTVGLTDAKKTTTSVFLSQLYNRKKGMERPPRLDSSIPYSIKAIYSKSNYVHVFDDLCPSKSNSVQRYQENIFRQIVRIIGDGVVPGRDKGLDIEMPPPESGVILTAEYFIDLEPSDAARLLQIEVAPLGHETLERFVEFQKDKPLVVSTLYRNFIQWIISNYDWARELLKEWWVDAYSKLDFAEHCGMKVHGRLKETHYYLNTAYIMFLEYCSEIGSISEDEMKALHQAFLELLTDLVLAQQVRVNKSKPDYKPDVKFDGLSYIRNLLTDGTIRLAPSAKEFNEAAHDGVEHLERLYIHSDRFREYICAANANLDEVLTDLKAQGALHHEKDARTAQLVVGKKKRRCYAIKLTKLK